MVVRVNEFDWDAANIGECRKHGVSITEIEQLFESMPGVFPNPVHSHTDTRFRAIGEVGNHYIFAVFSLQRTDQGLRIWPITARYMDQREIDHYEHQDENRKAASGSEK